jgi:hypothetical protein
LDRTGKARPEPTHNGARHVLQRQTFGINHNPSPVMHMEEVAQYADIVRPLAATITNACQTIAALSSVKSALSSLWCLDLGRDT